MDVTCVTDIFKFMHRVMNLEVDELIMPPGHCGDCQEVPEGPGDGPGD